MSDDLLGQLGPASAMELLLAPSGAVKGCMDGASQAEREFAMRTAVASQRIGEWLEELQSWNWPEEGGEEGFQPGAAHSETSRKLFASGTQAAVEGQGQQYMGSLLAQDVARYLWRIDEIQHGLNDLELEDIKAHILTHHIVPVPRPGTPGSDRSRHYTRMDDLSAIVTAIVVQSLPNLAKLTALIHAWTMRLAVLPQIPAMLTSLQEAETTLEAAWEAVMAFSEELAKYNEADGRIDWEQSLTRESFAVMKKSLSRKVAKPGKALDYMLDCLEGLGDTVPEEWLDRMESAEHSYGDWVVVGERKLREAEWARNLQRTEKPALEQSQQQQDDLANRHSLEAIDNAAKNAHQILQQQQEELTRRSSFVEAGSAVDALGIEQPATPSMSKAWLLDEDTFDGTMSPVHEADDEEEPGLPPLNDTERLDSDDLLNDTVLHGASSHFGGLSSDMPEVSGSPAARGPVRELQYVGQSPPSSPPTLDHGIDDDSPMMLLDSPSFSSAPDYDDTVFTKSIADGADGSFTEDFDDSYSVSELSTTKLRRESVGEQHLRQQISNIISSIPAKIKLSSEPTKEINLNPPDLQLPRLKKKSSKEPFRRNASGLSSRTVTPSFTLSPAKTTRPRQSRGQQEIKVYHLSRSTGEAPIKLFIRCVGENGERVMVRVGGGWADLSEYLKEYATHHGRRSGRGDETTVEIRDLPQNGLLRLASKEPESAPTSRPGSAASQAVAPSTPLQVRKLRKGMGVLGNDIPRLQPRTPALREREGTPASEDSTRSRSSSRLSWTEEDSSFLGLAGPSGRRLEMSEESKAWVETVKQKVRIASGEHKPPTEEKGRFGDLGKVGGTKRLFRKAGDGTARRS